MRASTVSDRRGRLLALALAACLIVVGLTAGTAPAQKQADSLRVVISAQVNVDPIVASRGGQWVWGTFLEPLIRVDSSGKLLKTGIVTNWTHSGPVDVAVHDSQGRHVHER